MRYLGGTLDTTIERPTEASVYTSEITGSVTITGLRGRKFTLHRVDDGESAKFYMTYGDKWRQPVLNDTDESDEVYENRFTVFTIDGDVLARNSMVTLRTDNGSLEAVWVSSFEVHPSDHDKPQWLRKGHRGICRAGKKHPRRRPHVNA